MKKTVLITGVNGFVGSHVASYLQNDFHVIGIGSSESCIVSSLSDYKRMVLPDLKLVELISTVKPHALVHCAGRGSVPFSVENPEADFLAGPQLVMHVLESIRLSGVRTTFLFPSSAAVYGNPKHLPVSEKSELKPISPYGHHKLLSEMIVKEYHDLYGQKYVCMRIFSCYGEGLKKQILWDAAVKATQGRVDLFGTGEETRDFIHIDDLACIVSMLVADNVTDLTLNVANGEQVKIRDIIELLVSSLNSNAPVCFNGKQRKGDPVLWEADVSSLSRLGFVPQISLQDGVRRFAEWFLGQR